MAINKKALDAVIQGTPAERHYLCGKDFSLFFCYYFSEYIKYPFAPFHFDFFEDIKGMQNDKYREVAWIGFRECAKTSFSKIYLTWLIVYKKKKYINVDSYSTTNAERILFDVILNLQTNKLLISDFGHLYNAKRDENETTQKRVNNFVANNGVRVEAHSTGKSVRGRLHGNQRPDFLLLDDFETNDTKDSKLTTSSIIAHIDEFKSGLDSSANVLYLGNLITDNGSIATLYERAKTDSRLIVRQVDAETPEGKPTWSSKYVMTDIEAEILNRDLTENKFVSLEDKKRQLGSLVYSAEMMNQPVSGKSGIFKREMFRYITRTDLEKKNTRKFATIDSALSKDAESDATGVVRNYVDDQNFWHLSAKEYRINPKGLIDLMFQLYDEGMEKIGIETTTFTQAIQPFFEDECRKRGKYPHIVQLKHGGVMKETRIEALVPYYEGKTIVHIEGECEVLEDQLIRFPLSKHDDVSDATQYMRFIAQSAARLGKPTTVKTKYVYNPRRY
jgi:phage terminase large subunit-like protein